MKKEYPHLTAFLTRLAQYVAGVVVIGFLTGVAKVFLVYRWDMVSVETVYIFHGAAMMYLILWVMDDLK